MADFRDAEQAVGEARDFFTEDARLHRIRYHLLRLGAMAPLSEQEVDELGEFARLVFLGDGGAADVAAKITGRPDASPLAVALASVVPTQEGSGFFSVDPREVLTSAISAAYLCTGQLAGVDRSLLAPVGALAGATAVLLRPVVTESISEVSSDDYLRMQD
ncbi:hypothetical protein ACIRD3_09320 [Kitasatospora sp. NPDC093550]|uniref:hypothetical protein n=1 Tax=Kitasatospora sp. NPDC093550 TaxID=3364089 RepID=UPI003801DDB8